MSIVIASLSGLILGGIIVFLLAFIGSASTQDIIQHLCANCTEYKKSLLVKILQHDINWVDMNDDEIANKIIDALYTDPNQPEDICEK